MVSLKPPGAQVVYDHTTTTTTTTTTAAAAAAAAVEAILPMHPPVGSNDGHKVSWHVSSLSEGTQGTCHTCLYPHSA